MVFQVHPSTKDVVSIAEAAELTRRSKATIRKAISSGRIPTVHTPSGLHPAGYGSGFLMRRADVGVVFSAVPEKLPPPHVCDGDCQPPMHVTYVAVQLVPDPEDLERDLRREFRRGTLHVLDFTRSDHQADGLHRLESHVYRVVMGDASRLPWTVWRVSWTD